MRSSGQFHGTQHHGKFNAHIPCTSQYIYNRKSIVITKSFELCALVCAILCCKRAHIPFCIDCKLCAAAILIVQYMRCTIDIYRKQKTSCYPNLI